MRRRGRRFFERREAKAETTFSRANALLHITFTFFETRETQHATRARSFARIYGVFLSSRARAYIVWAFSHTFSLSHYIRQLGTRRLRASTTSSSFASSPIPPNVFPKALPHFFPEVRASMARSTSSFFCTWCMVYM